MMFEHSLPSSIRFANPHDQAKDDHLCDPHSENWLMHLNPGKRPVSMNSENNHADTLSPLTYPSSSQFTEVSCASKHSALKYVYRRRKPQKQYIITSTGQTSKNKESGVLSLGVSSDAKSVAAREENTIHDCQLEICVSNIDPLNVNPNGMLSSKALEHPGSEEFPNKNMNLPELNNICPSPKSNLEVGAVSAITILDDTVELSSHLLGMEKENQSVDISEKAFCVSFLRSHGRLGNEHIRTSDVGESTSGSSGSRTCKRCSLSECTVNLLICDHCDNAFHAWCCQPRVNDIPIDEWLCNCCVKRKQKLLKEMKLLKLQKITEEAPGNNIVETSDDDLSCLDIMLLNTDPHKSEVRVGKGFQADVLEWSGPNSSDSDLVGEALETDLSESERFHSLRLRNPCRLSPIGNWLQCREVIHGIRPDIDGTVCGKWRRAPLSEVQRDDWECFCAHIWDPVHSDCAAPQEAETEEVLKQLKYIQMVCKSCCSYFPTQIKKIISRTLFLEDISE
ncbi:hypothetical protein QQ045_027654 [Rhodiola kirilowii]